MPLATGRPNTSFNTVFAFDSLTLASGFPAYKSGSKKLLLSRLINFVYSWNETPLKRKGLDFQGSLRELGSQILLGFNAAGNLTLKKIFSKKILKNRSQEVQRGRNPAVSWKDEE